MPDIVAGSITAPQLVDVAVHREDDVISVTFAHSRGGHPYSNGGVEGYKYRLFAADSLIAESILYKTPGVDSSSYQTYTWRVELDAIVYDNVRIGAVDSRLGASPLSNSIFVSTVPTGTGIYVKNCESLTFEDCEFDNMDTVFLVEKSSMSVSRSMLVPAVGGTYYDFDEDSVNVEFGNEYRRPQ